MTVRSVLQFASFASHTISCNEVKDYITSMQHTYCSPVVSAWGSPLTSQESTWSDCCKIGAVCGDEVKIGIQGLGINHGLPGNLRPVPEARGSKVDKLRQIC